MTSFPTHAPALLIGKKGFKSQTAANDTYLNGAAVDRIGARSGLAVVLACFTTAAGAAGATNTLTVKVEHDSDSSFGTAATLKAYTKVLTWAANGANEIYAFVPLDLTLAKRYVRVCAKLASAGTVTISLQEIAASVVLAGLDDVPASAYDADGYAATVEPSA
jgi:hypothetical protein